MASPRQLPDLGKSDHYTVLVHSVQSSDASKNTMMTIVKRDLRPSRMRREIIANYDVILAQNRERAPLKSYHLKNYTEKKFNDFERYFVITVVTMHITTPLVSLVFVFQGGRNFKLTFEEIWGDGFELYPDSRGN